MSASPLGRPSQEATAEEPWREGPGILASVWRYRVLVLLFAVLFGAVGYVLALQQPPTYQARGQLFLSNPRSAAVFTEGQPSIDTDQYVSQQLSLLLSRTVSERTSALMNGRLSPEQVDGRVSAEPAEEGSFVVRVAATGDTPAAAEEIANLTMQAFSEVATESTLARAQQAAAQLDPQRQDYQRRIGELQQQLIPFPDNTVVQSQIEALNGQLLELESRAQQLLVNAGAFGDGIDVTEAAVASGDPISPSPVRDAIVFALLGAGAATAFAYWRAGRARVVTNRDDPARILGAPLLGEIPNYPGRNAQTLSGQLAFDPAAIESYQFVLASIEYALEDVAASSVLVTSAAPGEGKTTTALQLALAASRDGRRIVLMDADIRAQGLTRLLGVINRTGLTELAREDLDVDQSVHYLPVSDELLLPIVAAGGQVSDPGGFFRGARFRKALQRIKDEAELVVLDSSPLLAVADTSVIAGQVGGIVVVIDRRTRLREIELLRERLSFISTPVLGYVYNRADTPSFASYGYGQMPQIRTAESITPVPPRASRGGEANRA